MRDTSTTITDHSLHPVSPDIFTPGSEAEAQFATMFSGTQHPAISYVTEIIPVGLGNCGGSPPRLNGGECVEMPALDIAPTTEQNTQNLLAMFAEKQQPYTRHSVETYRCECPPSWVGVACEESVADAADRASQSTGMFQGGGNGNQDNGHGGGGGHRRRSQQQTVPALAAVKIDSRGQTPALAHAQLSAVLNRTEESGDRRRLRQYEADSYCAARVSQLQSELQQCRSRSNCTSVAGPGAGKATVPSARRRAQSASAASIHTSSDGSLALCPVRQCALAPCQNGGESTSCSIATLACSYSCTRWLDLSYMLQL